MARRSRSRWRANRASTAPVCPREACWRSSCSEGSPGMSWFPETAQRMSSRRFLALGAMPDVQHRHYVTGRLHAEKGPQWKLEKNAPPSWAGFAFLRRIDSEALVDSVHGLGNRLS